MSRIHDYTIIATYINRKTGQRREFMTTVTGTINDAKRKSKMAFRSNSKARVLNIKVISSE